MSRLEVRGLHKAFGATEVLRGLDLDVPSGALAAVLGPSGCGKTTLLRVLAGFETVDAGTVHLGGRLVADVPVEGKSERDLVELMLGRRPEQLYPEHRTGEAETVLDVQGVTGQYAAGLSFTARRGEILGFAGLVLYSYEPAVAGALLGALVIVRPRRHPPLRADLPAAGIARSESR